VDGDARLAAYTIFGTLVAFKIVTALYILSLYPSAHAAIFLGMTNVVWFGLIMLPVLLSGGFWFRRWRVRRKRAQLIYAEWNVERPVVTGLRGGSAER
jgi:hypothetical protein